MKIQEVTSHPHFSFLPLKVYEKTRYDPEIPEL